MQELILGVRVVQVVQEGQQVPQVRGHLHLLDIPSNPCILEYQEVPCFQVVRVAQVKKVFQQVREDQEVPSVQGPLYILGSQEHRVPLYILLVLVVLVGQPFLEVLVDRVDPLHQGHL